jgi:hypothetical protein
VSPKLAPCNDITIPPDDTLETENEKAGILWTASELSNEIALKATLNVSRLDAPLSDDKRHDILVSLDQKEAAHAVTVNRADGDDAMLANEWPEMTKSALPVVGTQLEDEPVTTGSG